MKKTLKQWEESNKDFNEFIKPMDEIDEDLYNYFAECTAIQYQGSHKEQQYYQTGEASDILNDVYFYETFTFVNNRFFYLGIFPEFKQ